MKQVDSVKDITDNVFLLKYGQEFCIPCEMTERNLESLEEKFSVPFYSCMNIDESIEEGYTALPAIILVSNGSKKTLTQVDIMMDEDELEEWIKNNIE